ncbi:MAG: DUF6250 domain-containing protein, partial [Armatimonadota bacterium]
LYTVGIVCEGCGTESNFRFLGSEMPEGHAILKTPRSEIADEHVEEYMAARRRFQAHSINSTTTDAYTIGEWMHYQVVVDGGLVRVFADGRLLHEVTDRTPLTSGRFGFRNFASDTDLQVRNPSVVRP